MVRADELGNRELWRTLAEKSAYDARRMSSELDVSSRQLSRYTHQLFGESAQKWLNEMRLMRSRDLLLEHRSIKTVAFKLGFKQVSHFSREFKFFFGVPPTAYLMWNDEQKREL